MLGRSSSFIGHRRRVGACSRRRPRRSMLHPAEPFVIVMLAGGGVLDAVPEASTNSSASISSPLRRLVGLAPRPVARLGLVGGRSRLGRGRAASGWRRRRRRRRRRPPQAGERRRRARRLGQSTSDAAQGGTPGSRPSESTRSRPSLTNSDQPNDRPGDRVRRIPSRRGADRHVVQAAAVRPEDQRRDHQADQHLPDQAAQQVERPPGRRRRRTTRSRVASLPNEPPTSAVSSVDSRTNTPSV